MPLGRAVVALAGGVVVANVVGGGVVTGAGGTEVMLAEVEVFAVTDSVPVIVVVFVKLGAMLVSDGLRLVC
jgi:hypothetical protein